MSEKQESAFQNKEKILEQTLITIRRNLKQTMPRKNLKLMNHCSMETQTQSSENFHKMNQRKVLTIKQYSNKFLREARRNILRQRSIKEDQKSLYTPKSALRKRIREKQNNSRSEIMMTQYEIHDNKLKTEGAQIQCQKKSKIKRLEIISRGSGIEMNPMIKCQKKKLIMKNMSFNIKRIEIKEKQIKQQKKGKEDPQLQSRTRLDSIKFDEISNQTFLKAYYSKIKKNKERKKLDFQLKPWDTFAQFQQIY